MGGLYAEEEKRRGCEADTRPRRGVLVLRENRELCSQFQHGRDGRAVERGYDIFFDRVVLARTLGQIPAVGVDELITPPHTHFSRLSLQARPAKLFLQKQKIF